MPEYTHHIPPECHESVDILYEDEHVLVVVKPSGLLSVPGRIVKDCVVNRFVDQHPLITAVHRLDLDTSGVMVLSLSKLATSALNKAFRERRVGKVYEAVAYGETVDEGVIDFAIAPDPVNRPRQRIHASGKAARTRFLKIGQERSGLASRLQLMPETGRSHQLRIHLAHVGHPILGCDLYAHKEAFEMSGRLQLHARELSFAHPLDNKLMSFSSEVPF